MLARLSTMLALTVLYASLAYSDTPLPRFTASTPKPFDEVVEDLKFAITEYNFRITGHHRIGKAIAEREQKPFRRASVFHFCNLEYARKILEVRPSYIVHMPCRITVYEEQQDVIVDANLLPLTDSRLNDINTKVNDILKAIVNDAVE